MFFKRKIWLWGLILVLIVSGIFAKQYLRRQSLNVVDIVEERDVAAEVVMRDPNEVVTLPTKITDQDAPIIVSDKKKANWISEPMILKHKGKYLMVAEIQRLKDLDFYPNGNFVIGFLWSDDGIHFGKVNYPDVNAADKLYYCEGMLFPITDDQGRTTYHLWYVTTDNYRILYTHSNNLAAFNASYQMVNFFTMNGNNKVNLSYDKDIKRIDLPFIMLDDNENFNMFFPVDTKAIYRSVSKGYDSVNFRLDPPYPVIKTGEPGDWDQDIVIDPCVVRYGGYFIMFYGGARVWHYENGKRIKNQCSIGVAVSRDGYSWKKSELNPIVTQGGWADLGSAEPYVIQVKDHLFRLYYAGYSSNSKYIRAIGQMLIDIRQFLPKE